MATKREEIMAVLGITEHALPYDRHGFESDDGTWGSLVHYLSLRIDGASGCLARAQPDEPLFILRAQDAFAPLNVRAWADHLAATGRLSWDHPKLVEARTCADAMEAWQAEHGSKVPD